MIGYFRTRPFLLAGAAIAAIILLGIVLVAAFATIRNSSATSYYGMIADSFRNRPDLHPFESSTDGENGLQLFGMTEADGMAMLQACSHSEWVLLGIEQVSDGGCPYDELARCDIENKSLIARRVVWMRSRAVSFYACRAGYCPDFPVDVATQDPPADCPSAFELKINKRN